MAYPEPSNVAPWYLRDVCQALQLDEVSGNVFMRTGIQGNVYVTGPVTIPGTVTVDSTAENPVHVHLDEVGTSGILNVPYLPIGGNVVVTSMPSITGNVGVTGNVGIIGNANVIIQGTPNVNANVSGNVGVIGNVNVTQGTSPWVITGNANVTGDVNANVTGNVGITGNANVTGNVGIIGNVNVTQGTSPWQVTGNVTTTPALSVGDFYGEPYAIPITPVVQNYGVYGINQQDIQTYTALGGTATAGDSCFVVSSSTTTGSYGLLRSRRFNTYKPGQSMIARFFSKFDTPTVGTTQRVGIQNQEGAYYIGYNGATFGILHTYNGQAPIYRINIASYTGAQTVTLTLNGVVYTINLLVGETIDNAAQRIAIANFGGAWLATQKDNTVELLATSVGPMSGTFSITSSGNLSATITQIQAGVTATNQWLVDGVDFTKPTWLDPTKFVQYQIKYSWAGANFFALNPSTGQYNLFYQLIWAGSSAATELPIANPAFKVAALALSTGSSTPVTVRVASMMSGLEGATNRNNYSGGTATTDTNITQNTLHHLISIQNPYTFYGTINTKEALLDDLTVTTQANDPTEVYVYLDAPLLTGIQDFISQNGYSVTVSKANGTIDPLTNFPIASFVVGNTGSSVQFNLRDYRVAIPPGSTVSIAVRSTATIQKASAAVVWYND